MTTNDNSHPRFFKPGLQVYEITAKYQTPIVPAHVGNPNIEALPRQLEEKEWMEKLVRYPDFDASYRSLSISDRFNMLEDVRRFYQPLNIPLLLAMDFDTVLRSGYAKRNPFSPEYRHELLDKRDEFNVDKLIMNEFDDDGITTSGLTIKGLSGMGKTRSINRILSWYPQVIVHTNYHEKPCFYKQLVYLKFDCPPQGTLRAFAEDALSALDEKLGTDYFHKYSTGRGVNTNTLLRGFLNMATEHYLGALILDEIGNLVGAKDGRILQNTLIRFSNDFHFPIILIGNPTAERLLATEFRQMRRSYGYNEYNTWLQMKREDDDWDIFVEALWHYQYVKEPVKLTPALKNKLHAISGGITDLAVKIFISAQKRAMRDGGEKITASLLQFIANEEFSWAKRAVQVLKLGTPQALREYEDLYSKNVKKPKEENQPAPPAQKAPQPEIPPVESAVGETKTPPIGDTTENNQTPIKNDKDQYSKGKSTAKGQAAGLLTQIVIDGRKSKKTAYQSIKEAGWIGTIQDYI